MYVVIKQIVGCYSATPFASPSINYNMIININYLN